MTNCMFCTEGCEFCTITYPSWFTSGKNTPQFQKENVAKGLHPFGFPLKKEGDETCKTCNHMIVNRWGHNKWFKCALYAGNSKSIGSDLRIKWRACEHYKVKAANA